MLNHHRWRVVSRVFMLLILTVALLVISSDPVGKKAAARVPCEECEERYNNCVASCEPCSSAALNFCANRYNVCIANCT